MALNSPFRWLITCVLAVAVPLCCCSVESAFRSGSACGADETQPAATGHCQGGRDLDSSGAAGNGEHGDGGTKCPGHEQQGCTCGGDTKTSSVEAKPLAKFTPALPLDFPSIQGTFLAASPRCGLLLTDTRSPLIGVMSLLHQHCALNV